MPENSVIICKPTQWIKVRAVLIIAMFGVFAYLFYTDGNTGYRDKNEQYVYYDLFTNVAQKKAGKVADESEWVDFVATKAMDLPSEELCPLPRDFDRQQLWPEMLKSHYASLKDSNTVSNKAWEEYAEERGWDLKVGDHPEDQSSLNTQFYMAYGSLTLVVIVLFLFLRTLSRTMEVTETSYIAPGRKVVPFSSMRRIDTRKWDSKGVATIEYEVDGEMKKVKVDGMIYGQFKKEEGEPAEKLYAFIMDHFKGELIEFEVDEEDQESEDSGSPRSEGENSEPA